MGNYAIYLVLLLLFQFSTSTTKDKERILGEKEKDYKSKKYFGKWHWLKYLCYVGSQSKSLIRKKNVFPTQPAFNSFLAELEKDLITG